MARPDQPLLGRDAELAQLEAGLAAAAVSNGGVALVTGEIGIGKSRLVAELAARARAMGSRVTYGASPMTASPVPFGAIIGALTADVDKNGPEILAKLGEAQLVELMRLAPSLRAPVSRPGGSPAASAAVRDGELEDDARGAPQVATYEALLAYLRQFAAAGQTGTAALVVLDDVHWADTGTTDFLSYVAPSLETLPLLVVVTARLTELKAGTPARRWLLELARLDNTLVIELRPLSREEAIQVAGGALAMAVARRPPGVEAEKKAPARGRWRDAETVARRAGGNPYLLVELALAVARGDDRLPTSVEGLLRERLSDLSDAARHVANVAAVNGGAGPLAAIDTAATVAPSVAGDAMRELRDGGLMHFDERQWAFTNPLVAELLYGDLLPAERAALHRRWAVALESLTANSAASAAGAKTAGGSELVYALAMHWYRAADPGRALPVLLRAANAATDSRAFREAHVLYERALEAATSGNGAAAAAPTSTVAAQRGPIGFRPGSTTGRSDGTSEFNELLERAAQAAAYAGSPLRAAELMKARLSQADVATTDPSLRERLAWYLFEAGAEEESLAEYERAEAGIEGRDFEHDAHAAARLYGSHARALLLAGRFSAGERLARQALEAAIEARSIFDEYRARMTLGSCLAMTEQISDALEQLEAGRRIEEILGSASGIRVSRIVDVLAARLSAAAVLSQAGQTESAARIAQAGRSTAARLGVRDAWAGMLSRTAVNQLFDIGRWTEAEELAADLVNSETTSERVAGHVVRTRIFAARGDLAAATGELEASRQLMEFAPSDGGLRDARADFHLAAAELAFASSDYPAALAAVDEGLAWLGMREARGAALELATVGLRAAAEHALHARSRGATSELADIRSSAAVLRAVASSASTDQNGERAASVPRVDALRALASAESMRLDESSSADEWAGVAESFERLTIPYAAAYARYREAEALASRSDRQAAAKALGPALETALELGAQPLISEIHALARRARVDLEQVAPAAGATEEQDDRTADHLGLSARELEVLFLLTDGKTNKEIAANLFISEKTASHHVSNILSKLGVRGRVEAAAVAMRMGIEPGRSISEARGMAGG